MLTWDQSHDYVLHRFWNELTRVTICFQASPPSVQEMLALRRCVPQFREMTVAGARKAAGETKALYLGEMPTREARRLIEAAQAQGLEVLAESASHVSYLPFDRTTGCAWLIEDATEAAAVAQAMLAAGIPVQEVQA